MYICVYTSKYKCILGNRQIMVLITEDDEGCSMAARDIHLAFRWEITVGFLNPVPSGSD